MTATPALQSTISGALLSSDSLPATFLAAAWQAGAHHSQTRARVATRPELHSALRAAVATDAATSVRGQFLARADLTAAELAEALRTATPDAVAYAAHLTDDPDRLAVLAAAHVHATAHIVTARRVQLDVPAPTTREALIAMSHRRGVSSPDPEEAAFILADVGAAGDYLARLDAPETLSAIVRRSDVVGAALHPLTRRLRRLADRNLDGTIDLVQDLIEEGRLDATAACHVRAAVRHIGTLDGASAAPMLWFLRRSLREVTEPTIDAIGDARGCTDPAQLHAMTDTDHMWPGFAWAVATNPYAEPNTVAVASMYVASTNRLVDVHRSHPDILAAVLSCPHVELDGPLGPLPRPALVAAAGNSAIVLSEHSPLEAHCAGRSVAHEVACSVPAADAVELIRRQTAAGVALAAWLATWVNDVTILEGLLTLAETFCGTLADLVQTAPVLHGT